MSPDFEILRALSDAELDDHVSKTVARLSDLDELARLIPTGLPYAKDQERRILEDHCDRVKEEQRRRAERDEGSLNTATAFHEAAPELLKVLETGNAVILAKYLHDRSDSELDLLAANGRKVAELAERIVKFRRSDVQQQHEETVEGSGFQESGCRRVSLTVPQARAHKPEPCGKEDYEKEG